MKGKFKKVILIIILLVIVSGIIWVAINASEGKKEAKIGSNVQTTVEKVSQSEENTNVATNTVEEATTITEKEIVTATETKLADGIKYSVTDKEVTPEIVLKDNYYDTQISDINLNFDKYEGKTIQIDGFYFENEDYTFVGRYSTSNLCQYCPTGYSYFEYEWHGDKTPELTDSESWIKVIGTLKKGNDGVEYYYIDADSVEVMNEKGLETVSN